MTQRERPATDGGAPACGVAPAPLSPADAPPPGLTPLLQEGPAPRPAPSPCPPAQADAAARRALLPALLTGHTADLAPLRPAADAGRPDLAPAEREAVARVVHTPDVCLVQGLPGTGKSRVVAAALADAAARGERV